MTRLPECMHRLRTAPLGARLAAGALALVGCATSVPGPEDPHAAADAAPSAPLELRFSHVSDWDEPYPTAHFEVHNPGSSTAWVFADMGLVFFRTEAYRSRSRLFMPSGPTCGASAQPQPIPPGASVPLRFGFHSETPDRVVVLSALDADGEPLAEIRSAPFENPLAKTEF